MIPNCYVQTENPTSLEPKHHHGLLTNNSRKTNNRQTLTLATVIIILLVISIANTITLMVIIYRLRLIPGLEFFSFVGENLIFHKDVYINRILLGKNRISGLSTITGNLALESGSTSLHLNDRGIQISSASGLEIRSPTTGKLLFPFDVSSLPLNSLKTLSVPGGVRDVKLIRSPIDEDLNIFSKQNILIKGNEGVRIDGKQIQIKSPSIFLSSINSSIVLDGSKGIYLNMDSFRQQIVQQTSKNSSSSEGELQYKLCICGRNGRLFRIEVKDHTSSCADARFPQSDNPCLH